MTVIATELWQLSAVELAAAIRSRNASCRDVVEAHQRRIEAVNAAVNAVVVVLGEQALAGADAAERAVAAGQELALRSAHLGPSSLQPAFRRSESENAPRGRHGDGPFLNIPVQRWWP
jgi:hypothetical protein